jgi:hypothetical protein
MQMSDADYSGLLVRVTRLERQNRFWKTAGLLVLLAVVLSLAANVAAQVEYGVPAPRATIEAHTYLLKDSAGVLRGKMTVDGDRHPVLEFYDLDGNVEWSTDTRAVPAK